MRQHAWVICSSFLMVMGLGLPAANGQRLYGGVAATGGLHTFTTSAGGACAAPLPGPEACLLFSGCPATVPSPVPSLGTLLGDVATNRIKDTVWATDGFTIHEYSGDLPCATSILSCMPLDSFFAPTFLGTLTGMGMDSAGGTVTPAGTPVLWVTDGALVAGLVPGSGCVPPTLVSGPFATGIACSPSGMMTDVSWDPLSGTLWLCDSIGFVHNIFIGGGCASPSFSAVPGNCGTLSAPLLGLAFDTAWTADAPIAPETPKLYVTDGFTVEYVTDTGVPAGATFYTPTTCTTTAALMNGLALAGMGVNYGFNRVLAEIGSFGQSSSPGPSWGLELRRAPLGDDIWLAFNFSFPGPGYYCPPVFAQGTNFWVDPGFPGGLMFLGSVTAPCMTIPLPLAPGLPDGLTVFTQFFTTAGTVVSDATGGLAFTIHRP